MSENTVLDQLASLSATVARLEQRVEDLEDLRDLENAIVQNGQKPLIPWENARQQLDLD
jgi:hypothetical protein